MEDDRVLLVLYTRKDGEQSWCMYAGGNEEADDELELLSKENPGIVERGRIWATRTTTFVAVAE